MLGLHRGSIYGVSAGMKGVGVNACRDVGIISGHDVWGFSVYGN